jgi:hypothetical protein
MRFLNIFAAQFSFYRKKKNMLCKIKNSLCPYIFAQISCTKLFFLFQFFFVPNYNLNFRAVKILNFNREETLFIVPNYSKYSTGMNNNITENWCGEGCILENGWHEECPQTRVSPFLWRHTRWGRPLQKGTLLSDYLGPTLF